MATSSVLAGLTLLVIGESHMSFPDSLMNPLYDELTRQGAQVHAIGACGANAEDWVTPKLKLDCGATRDPGGALKLMSRGTMSTEPITQVIARDKPDVVVLIIGDTLASYKTTPFPKVWAYQSVTALTRQIAATHTPCVWVGPAWGKANGSNINENQYGKNQVRTQLVASTLAKMVAPCTYIDSTQLSKPGQWVTSDGQHFTIAGYKAWANALGTSLSQLPASALKGATP
ncbi:SGNH/GDSL hydrolase family protein [Pseudomonas kurunegalensis]|uniref:SGNH/GDSL hydrolase family protein n=1 Tax=Pseudomonas kurunegalensis TaxID=485880 RepID=UPI002570016D|nr:SGNH/GDSL hydrolase family protein [Pseudomonas kurunegalensis]WJD60335.1 SGNH/GDSL hydrolase family protein [Pseudomonas kurunegalensis]